MNVMGRRECKGPSRTLALPISGARQGIRRQHRFTAIRRNLNAARTIEAQKRLDAEQGIEPEEVSGVPFPVAAAEFLTWCHSTCYRSKEMNPLKAYLAYYNVLEYYFEEAPALLPKLPGLSLNS